LIAIIQPRHWIQFRDVGAAMLVMLSLWQSCDGDAVICLAGNKRAIDTDNNCLCLAIRVLRHVPLRSFKVESCNAILLTCQYKTLSQVGSKTPCSTGDASVSAR
jgi:hypothetical protein